MEDNLDHYYDAVRTMFLTPGWQYFLEDLHRFTQTLRDISAVRDAEDLFYKQGQLNVAEFVLGFEEAVKAAQQTHEAEEEGER